MKMRDELVSYLGEMKKKAGFNFLLITGDIAHRGDSYNEDIKTFLNDLINEIEIPKNEVYIIPGNHDISREDKMRSLLIAGILSSANPSEKIDEIDEKSFETLLNAQSNFFDFYEDFLGVEYPKEELHFLKSAEHYNVFSINTCIISDKGGEEGNLLVGKKKFYNAINKLRKIDNEKKLNIAIGHHTLACIHPSEKQSIIANFDDKGIDLYLSGHVHSPAYNVTVNSSANPFVELVSGAVVSDEYAIPGFVVVDVNLDNGEAEACFHIWNTSNDYWAVNNQIGRRTRNGMMEFSLERLTKKKDSNGELFQDESVQIDENEFKQFIIDFHEKLNFEGPTRSNLDNKVELENKFYNMKCSDTFQKRFERYSRYFGTISNIMESTAYVSADKKDLIAEIIIDKYLEIHNNFNNGDEIFQKILDETSSQYENLLPYSKLKTKRYIKILSAWSIYECDIFNENKRFAEK